MGSRSFGFGRIPVAVAVIVSMATVGVSSAAAKTLRVSPKGHDTAACGVLRPCKTIGFAVAKAKNGDVVRVSKGIYKGSVTIAKDIELLGHNRPVIDATGLTNGIVITGTSARGARVGGFVVQNALEEGILAMSTSHVTIVNNLVRFNDKGALSSQLTGECAPAGAVPGDCGEGLHLMTVNHSKVVGNIVAHNLGGILLTDEFGPTDANLVSGNLALDNLGDCGITLAGHNKTAFGPGGPVSSSGGVYRNKIVGNVANGNGTGGPGIAKPQGGGILLAAGVPGAGVYSNLVRGNVANSNGLGGLTLHSHAPGQDLNDNKIVGNWFSHDDVRGDSAAGVTQTSGIIIFSAVTKLTGTVVRGNRLSQEYYGIWTQNMPTIKQSANRFAKSVTVDLFQK